jgi:hypothetical protein
MLTERDKMFGDGESELTEPQKSQKRIVEEVLENLIEDIEAGRVAFVEEESIFVGGCLTWEYE